MEVVMNEEYFINQIVEIRLDTEISLVGATSPQIRYERPNGTEGAWAATIQGTELVYTTNSTDLDIPGTWKLQAFVVKNGGNKPGAIIYETIREPITPSGAGE
jgi:hypothetical protein